MGIFDKTAGAEARHGTNKRANYFDWHTDTGDMIVMLESAPLKQREDKPPLVPVTMRVLVHVPGEITGVAAEAYSGKLDPVNPGSERTFVWNPSGRRSPEAAAINQQEFKALITAAANVPLADELAADAVKRLVELTGNDPGVDPDTASVNMLKGARDDLIANLMEKWTSGEGDAGLGMVLSVGCWPRPKMNDKTPVRGDNGQPIVYTGTRFNPCDDNDRAMVSAIIDAGDEGLEYEGRVFTIPPDLRDKVIIGL